MFKFGSFPNKLDEHIAGGHGHKTEIECRCKSNHTWTAKGYTEYGSTDFINEADAFCPECYLPFIVEK